MNINIHTSHPSAFISSTFLDLKPEREAVASVLKEANLNINALDVKPASDNTSKKEILAGINESDFFILIVGERYGSIIPQMTSSPILSITWWEYNHAKLNNKSILVFFKKDVSSDPVNHDHSLSSDYNLKREKLAAFKDRLSSRHNPKYFSTHEELAKEIKCALIPTYRSGVKKLLEKQKILHEEIESLKKEALKYRGTSIDLSLPSSYLSRPAIPSAIDSPIGSARNALSTGLIGMAREIPSAIDSPIGSARNTLSTGLGIAAIPGRYKEQS